MVARFESVGMQRMDEEPAQHEKNSFTHNAVQILKMEPSKDNYMCEHACNHFARSGIPKVGFYS